MRLWLGATWIYAGWDKASDPGFLTAGSPTFIGSQLAAYAQNSPIDFLLNKMVEHATQVGIFVMLSEFAVGFATLLWIAPTWAAFGGFLTSLTLWLSSTWNIQPYFLASTAFSSEPTVPITLTPNRFAICIAIKPTPPAAA